MPWISKTLKGGDRMKKEGSYVGKISNKGTQVVEAPLKQDPGKKVTSKKGDDLRSGKGK